MPGPGAPEPSEARRTGEYLSVATWLLGSLYESLLLTKINGREKSVSAISDLLIYIYMYICAWHGEFEI